VKYILVWIKDDHFAIYGKQDGDFYWKIKAPNVGRNTDFGMTIVNALNSQGSEVGNDR